MEGKFFNLISNQDKYLSNLLMNSSCYVIDLTDTVDKSKNNEWVMIE